MRKLLMAVAASMSLMFVRAEEHEHEHEHEQEIACEHDHEQDHEAEHEYGEERGIEVSEDAAQLIGLGACKVESRIIEGTQTFIGRMKPDERSVWTVSAPVAGQVEILVDKLQSVNKGDAIARIVSPDVAAKAREVEVLRARLEKIRAAGTKNAALESELSMAEIAFAAMTQSLKPVEGSIGTYLVTSPVNGDVTTIVCASGAFVDRGAELVNVSDCRSGVLSALVPVSEAQKLMDGQTARCGTENGTISIDRRRDDGMVEVRMSGVNSPIGTTLRFDVLVDASADSVSAIPEACIFQDGINPSVFVRDEHDADRWNVVPVHTGRRAGGWVEAKNLSVGTAVAREGVYELKLALPSKTGEKKEAGHFHADGKFHAGEEHE